MAQVKKGTANREGSEKLESWSAQIVNDPY